MGFQGVTAHWIEVKEGKWKMRNSVIGFRALSGAHDGENLGRYTVGLLDRVGIMDKKRSKVSWLIDSSLRLNLTSAVSQLYTAALDNTGNNNTTCKTIENIHVRRGLKWNSGEQQLPYVFFKKLSWNTPFKSLCSCLAHVVNLGNVDVMSHITKIAAVENTTAIWEYDPMQNNNRVLGDSLDVIAAIRTLAIKVILHVFYLFKSYVLLCRFKHLVNRLSTFRAHSSVADFLKLWRFLYTATFDEEPHIKC